MAKEIFQEIAKKPEPEDLLIEMLFLLPQLRAVKGAKAIKNLKGARYPSKTIGSSIKRAMPKYNINWQPGGVLADTMGNPHIVWPKFNLSFSTGAGGTNSLNPRNIRFMQSSIKNATGEHTRKC